MQIRITGSPRNITKAEVRATVRWMAAEMGIDRYRDPIWLGLKFRPNLKKKSKYRGSAVWEDRNYRPRDFTIEVDADLTKRVTITTLLHELVHVRQYAKGQLKDYMRHYSLKKWCNRNIDIACVKYRDYPWEIEAYDLEKVYYRKWVAYNKKKHVK